MHSMLLGMFDWIGDFFKAMFDLIPKIMYLLYASLACVIDVLQLFFRKLAGLDVFYVQEAGNQEPVKVAGDLVTNFITGILGINDNGFQYSALTTVFWSMILFGVIICFVSVFIAIIKSHYSYNEESAKGPMPIIYTGLKALVNMAVVPIVVVLGLYVSQAILIALDSITSVSSGNVEQMYGSQTSLLQATATSRSSAANADEVGVTGETTYIYYDIFGYQCEILYGQKLSDAVLSGGWKKVDLAKIASTQQSFSGSIFKVAAYNANRARSGEMVTTNPHYTGGSASSMKLFANAENDADPQTKLADMIDMAFACNLHLQNAYVLNQAYGGWSSVKYFTNFLTLKVKAFSKFNVGLVWYYYDLWSFNFIVGFGAIVVCVSIFINIILGLLTRLFMCIGLFLIAPPLFGLAPLDKGDAAKKWRENFIKQVLMAYGAVVGMNIFLLILPYMNEIKFFNIGIADYLAQTLVIIVGLITIKAFIETVSGFINAGDANKAGNDIKGEVGQTLGKAAALTGGAAKIGASIGGRVGIAGLKTMGKGAAKLGKGAAKVAKAIDDKTGNKISGVLNKAANTKFGKGVAAVGKKVGQGIAQGRKAIIKGGRWLGDKLTGNDKVKAAIEERKNAEKQQQEMNDYEAKNNFLKDVVGKGMSQQELEDLAVERGFDDKTIDYLKAAGTASSLSAAQAALSANDAKFKSGMNAGWNSAKIFRAEKQKRDNAVAYAQERYSQARTLKAASPVGFLQRGVKQLSNVFDIDNDKSVLGSFYVASGAKKKKEKAEGNESKAKEEAQNARTDKVVSKLDEISRNQRLGK